jgi:peptide subunit release factor RF-3
VCRAQNLPVITFFNKYDRPGRDPLELLDEVEQPIGYALPQLRGLLVSLVISAA